MVRLTQRPKRPRRHVQRAALRLLASRACITLTAACFVLALAIDVLAPLGLTLAEGLYRLDDGLPARLQSALTGQGRAWLWQALAVPLLRRPAWLPPLMLGLVSAGLAATIDGTARPDGRRP